MNIIVWILLIIVLYLLFKSRSDMVAAIARIKYVKGDTPNAIRLYKFANKIGKMGFDNRLQHAYCTLREGDIDEANKLFNMMAMEKISPAQRGQLKQSHALVLWKRGDIDGAIEMLEEVHSQFISTTTYGSLGYMYIHRGKLEKALEYNLEAYEYNSDNGIIVDNLAYTYLKSGDYENAEKYYKILFDMNPTFPEGYIAYGKYLVEKGEKEEGLALVKKALDCSFSFLSMDSRRDILDYLEEQGEDITKLI